MVKLELVYVCSIHCVPGTVGLEVTNAPGRAKGPVLESVRTGPFFQTVKISFKKMPASYLSPIFVGLIATS